MSHLPPTHVPMPPSDTAPGAVVAAHSADSGEQDNSSGLRLAPKKKKAGRLGHWRRKYGISIKKIAAAHEANILKLAKMAGVDKWKARRACKDVRPILSKANAWNSFQKDLKLKKVSLASAREKYMTTSKSERETLNARFMNGELSEEDVRGQIKKMQNKLLDFLKWAEGEFGYTTFAVMAHPDLDLPIIPLGSKHANRVMDQCVKRLNARATLDRLYADFERGVAWKEKPPTSATTSATEGSIIVPAAVSANQRAAIQESGMSVQQILSRRLRAFFDQGINQLVKDDAARKPWMKATKGKGDKMIFDNVFTTLSEMGLCVERWPVLAFDLLGEHTTKQVAPPQVAILLSPLTPKTIMTGNLRNTSSWRIPHVGPINDAITDKTMRIARVQS